MAVLCFTLQPEAILRLHDVLICMAKFSDSVSIEADHDHLRFSALNSTNTAYAAFIFDRSTFFSHYTFAPRQNTATTVENAANSLSCQIYNKALLSVFRGRVSDFKDKDHAIERCKVELHDGQAEPQCRFIIQMICRQGVVKTYKLTYEAVTVQHALFDMAMTQNQWAIDSRFLRGVIEHFAPTAEQLDLYSENGRAVFTSFTTKVTDGKEILKQPVHTYVAIDTKDFDDFLVEEKLHVVISAKDFKAIIIHADTLKAEGMTCEFTLMTRGDGGETTANASLGNRRELPARPLPSAAQALAADGTEKTPLLNAMEPARHATAQSSFQAAARPEAAAMPPPQGLVSLDPDNLFLPVDDDKHWDEPSYGDEEEDTLGWDASIGHDELRASIGGRIQDKEPSVTASVKRISHGQTDTLAIPPTQRISQIRGLFD